MNSNSRATSSTLLGTSSNPRVTSSNLWVTSSNPQVTSSNLRVTGSKYEHGKRRIYIQNCHVRTEANDSHIPKNFVLFD